MNQLLDPMSQKFVQLSLVMNCFFQSMTTLRQGQSVYLSREGHIKKDFCIFGLFLAFSVVATFPSVDAKVTFSNVLDHFHRQIYTLYS